ncbi:hypothetical protein ACFQDF_33740 [Ectobacillus funiculus]
MKEIGEKTDIVFEYTTIKKGPSINAVKFKIRSNPNVKIKNEVIENKVSKVVENDEVLEIQKLGQEMGLKLSKKSNISMVTIRPRKCCYVNGEY